jgi:hypothetical protein
MSNEAKERLILRHRRHLQKLQEQKASLGLHTPAHILTEIEDTEAEIEKLERELGLSDDRPELKSLDEKRGRVSWSRIAVGVIVVAVAFGTLFLIINWYAGDKIVVSTPDSTRTSAPASSVCKPSPYSELPSHSIAIIEPDAGAKSQVPFNTLEYEKRSGLTLASGMVVDFRRMKSFQLSNKDFINHFTADVVITFLDCKTHQDVIRSESGSFLEGETEFGHLELHILDVKRVDFEWQGQ